MWGDSPTLGDKRRRNRRGILIHDCMKGENELNVSIHGFLPPDCGPLLQAPAAMTPVAMTTYCRGDQPLNL